MNCMRTKHPRTRKHKPPPPITLFSYWKNRSAIFSPASPSQIPLKTLNWSIFYMQDKHWLRSLKVTTFPKSVASFPCTETFDNTNLLRKLQAESSLLPFLQKAEGTKLRSGYMFISERELALAYTSKHSADTDAVICGTQSHFYNGSAGLGSQQILFQTNLPTYIISSCLIQALAIWL